MFIPLKNISLLDRVAQAYNSNTKEMEAEG
jgi:hypothetical protein